MLNNLFWVILFGGVSVVVSYYVLMLDDEVSKLWAGLQGTVFWLWIASMSLTILSYAYMFYAFCWAAPGTKVFTWPIEEAEPFLCACYTLFLGSASQYAYIAITDVRNQERSLLLVVNLWMTAMMSVILGSSAVALNGISPIENVLSVTAGLIFAIHHTVFDAIYWQQTFDPKYDQIV